MGDPGWFILRFEEQKGPGLPLCKDILYLDTKTQPIPDAARALENQLHEHFGRMGDMENGHVFRIRSLTVLPYIEAEPVEVTLMQLVTYLRGVYPPPRNAKRPDLFGFTTDVVRVVFEHVEIGVEVGLRD